MKTYYVTKWWQTRGVIVVRGQHKPDIGPKYISTLGSPLFSSFHLGRDAFETKEEAIADTRKKAERKALALVKEAARCRRIVDGEVIVSE